MEQFYKLNSEEYVTQINTTIAVDVKKNMAALQSQSFKDYATSKYSQT